MKKYLHYILPILIVTCLTLEHLNILHVGYLYIKSHELKWTDLDYGYHPKEGDIFTAGESVSQNNYEDGLIALQPDYKKLLDEDLKEISDYREHIDLIDGEDLTFFSDEYMIKACIDQKDISINDSTLFKKLVNVEIVGGYELYDKESSELLYQKENEKFWIRNQIIMQGYARRPFIENKIYEIVLAQMSNNAHEFIQGYEIPLYSDLQKALKEYTISINTIYLQTDSIQLKERSTFALHHIDNKTDKGTDILAHRNDPDYLSNIFQAEVKETKE